MKCPYCGIEVYPDFTRKSITSKHINNDFSISEIEEYMIEHMFCPSCEKIIIKLDITTIINGAVSDYSSETILLYPKSSNRPPCPVEVIDEGIVDDYNEACKVLDISPKASAALSRRCLQHLLRLKANTKQNDLSKQILEVIDSGKLPSHLSECIDAVRNIGNFAAHPIKDKSTGEILPVEVGEAEWNLDVLEQLFDFYYVQPAIILKKKQALNQKLQVAGKPLMK